MQIKMQKEAKALKKSFKNQSAMEYLMTYGWAILIIAVVLSILFYLGVFSGSSFLPQGCIAQSGFLCKAPILTTGGVLQLQIGEETVQTMNNTNIYFIPQGGTMSNASSASIGKLNSWQITNVSIPLPTGSLYPSSYKLGTNLAGMIYVSYTYQGMTLTDEIGTVTVKSVNPTGVILGSPPSSIPSGISEYVTVTMSNGQNSSTPAPFQQMVQFSEANYANYMTYNGNFANFEFFTSTGSIIPAWIESNSSGTITAWLNLPNGISASNSIQVYLGFASKTTNLLSNTGTSGIGEAAQLSSIYGEYEDIGSVMNSGLLYQIWGWGGSGIPPQSELYQAVMYPGSSFTFGSTTATTSSTMYTTPSPGTTQDVNGANQIYVIINYQNSYSGGITPPNPPVSNQNYWLVKAIGFVDYTSSTTLYGIADDGIGLGYNKFVYSFASWLGGTNNPNNIINEWRPEGATTYSGTIPNSGDYAIELDFENQGGPGYIGMWSSNSLNYYSPSYPPNGVMPSVSFGGVS